MEFVSFAPRFVGRFEKGVEYIGDINELQRDFEIHAEIARALGPYKLSLHSGSDKYSTYPLIAEATRVSCTSRRLVRAGPRPCASSRTTIPI